MVEQYLNHGKEIITSPYSQIKGNSKDTGLVSLFGGESQFDLREGHPVATTREVPIRASTHELIWFLRGDSNIKYLEDNKVRVWRKDVFNSHYSEMVKEGLFPGGLVKYSPDWEKAVKDFGQMVRESDDFAQRWGDAGPIYPIMWRHWPKYVEVSIDNNPVLGKDGKPAKVYIQDKNGIDQISSFIEKAKKNPHGKKYIVSAWDVAEVPNMSLPSCHTMFQLNVNGEEFLETKLHQRSGDYLLGITFNQIQYSDLTTILAQELDLKPRRFIHSFGDAHFYYPLGKTDEWLKNNFSELQEKMRNVEDREEYKEILDWMVKGIGEDDPEKNKYNHVTGFLEQLSREPRELPKRTIENKPFDKLTIDDFKLEGYNPHPPIKREMAV